MKLYQIYLAIRQGVSPLQNDPNIDSATRPFISFTNNTKNLDPSFEMLQDFEVVFEENFPPFN